MSRTTLTARVASAVEPGNTFTVDNGRYDQGDYVDTQTVTVWVYTRPFACNATSGVSEFTVTWPADAPYDLPSGTYYIEFDLVGGDPLGPDAAEATNIAALTDNSGGSADDTLAAVGDTSVADESPTINANFADLAAKYNALLANLKAAGLMEAD